MKEAVLSVAENQFSEIPKDLWAQHVQLRAKETPKILTFMTEDHHRVRYFVVRELPRIAKPIAPEHIAKAFDLSVSKTTKILDELEKNLFFLVRNDSGLGTFFSPQYHPRLLTEISLLLVRRTRQRASINIRTGQRMDFKPRAGCLFNTDDRGGPVCIYLIHIAT